MEINHRKREILTEQNYIFKIIKMVKAVSHKSFKLNRLKDPDYAQGYLNAALGEYFVDKNNKAFLVALKDVAAAQQNMTELSKTTNKNRQSLYKSLSERGNPTFETLTVVLKSLGFKLVIAK